MKTLPPDFAYLRDMYSDGYFPKPLVDRLRDTIKELVSFLESGDHTTTEIQDELDRVVRKINDLQDVFLEEDSEIETVARESIGETFDEILKFFEIDIDLEEALRERDW